MKSVLFVLLGLGACATTTIGGLDRGSSSPSSVRLDLVPHADATRTFPAVIAARLPTADRLAAQIRYELGEAASVDVRLCVAAAGRVESIAITRSSNLPAFDDSVIADASTWQFAALPGPATLRTCEHATITYRPRA
jgi:TonB family protein